MFESHTGCAKIPGKSDPPTQRRMSALVVQARRDPTERDKRTEGQLKGTMAIGTKAERNTDIHALSNRSLEGSHRD